MNEVRVNGDATTDELRSSEVSGSDAGGARGSGARSAQGPIPGGDALRAATAVQEGRSPSWVPEAQLDDDVDVAVELAKPARGPGRPKRAPKPIKHEVVASRFDEDGTAALDAVCSAYGVSKSAALRMCVEMVAESLLAPAPKLAKAVEARRPVVIQVDAGTAEVLKKALVEVSTRYGERSREIYAIGHNVNQLAKLAHVQGDSLTVFAVKLVEEALERIRLQLNADAERDAKALEVLSCLSSS